MDGPSFSTTLDDKRFYEWPLETPNGESLTHIPSITTHIKHGVPKPMITTWAIKKTARLAIDEFETLDKFMERINGTHS